VTATSIPALIREQEVLKLGEELLDRVQVGGSALCRRVYRFGTFALRNQ